MTSATWPASSSGRAVQIQAAAPATIGDEKLVPDGVPPVLAECARDEDVVAGRGEVDVRRAARERRDGAGAVGRGHRGDVGVRGRVAERACRGRRRSRTRRRRASPSRPPRRSPSSIGRSRVAAEAQVDDATAGARRPRGYPRTISRRLEARAVAECGVPRAERRPAGRCRRRRRRSTGAPIDRRDGRAVLAADAAPAPAGSARACRDGRRTRGAAKSRPESTMVTGTPGPGGVSPSTPICESHHSSGCERIRRVGVAATS